MANVLDCDFLINEFELQLYCHVHFWINSFGKSVNLLILLAMAFIVPLLFYEEGSGIK